MLALQATQTGKSVTLRRESEQVLYPIGLNMSEAVELFLRRVIADEKLPFEVIALDEAALATKMRPSPAESEKRGEGSKTRVAGKRIETVFSGTHAFKAENTGEILLSC
jgi:addiction module RelB/DinJ family antitoxin